MFSRDPKGSAKALKHGSKPVIGLIGAIGAGKSAAAKCFAARGGHVIDGDVLGHEALRQPAIINTLVERWGDRVRKPDGSLDRRAIAGIVFANSIERNALEALVFPYIGRRVREEIAAAQANPAVPFIVLDAAVMLEAGWNEIDRIVYVDAPRELRLARLAARSGWSEADLTARESAQWPADKKRAVADEVIVNDSSPVELQQQVNRLLKQWDILSEL